MENHFLRKNLVIMVGPSGSGKDTVKDILIEDEDKSFSEAISSTTRAPRVGEVEGIAYYFKTIEQFKKEKKNMIESVCFDETYYGIEEKEILESNTENIILIVEPNGLKQILEWHKYVKDKVNIRTLYLDVSKETQKERMLRRGDKLEDIEKRLRNDNIAENAKNFRFDLTINTETISSTQTAKIIKGVIE